MPNKSISFKGETKIEKEGMFVLEILCWILLVATLTFSIVKWMIAGYWLVLGDFKKTIKTMKVTIVPIVLIVAIVVANICII